MTDSLIVGWIISCPFLLLLMYFMIKKKSAETENLDFQARISGHGEPQSCTSDIGLVSSVRKTEIFLKCFMRRVER